MSDSGDEGAGGGVGGDGVKKDFTYKLKAFKRRTLHSIKKKTTGTMETTKDAKYENIYAEFQDADARMTTLLKSVKKYNDAQMQLAEAAAQLADDLHILYDGAGGDTSMLVALPSQLKQIHDNMATEIVPTLSQRWQDQVTEPINEILFKRFQNIKDDEARRLRYLTDYDHYRNKKAALEAKAGADKQEKLRENQAKLDLASGKYFAMQSKQMHRIEVSNKHKATMLNDQMLAMIAIQNDLFMQASNDLQKLYQTSRENKYLQAARAEAEDLAKADSGLGLSSPPVSSRPAMGFSAHSSGQGSPRGNSSMQSPWEDAKDSTPQPAGGMGAEGRKRVRCLFGYDATADIELDMKEGDVITVLREDDSGWWQGEIDGKVGWFPFNYVEPI